MGRPVNDQGEIILRKSLAISAVLPVILIGTTGFTATKKETYPCRGGVSTFRSFTKKVWEPKHWRRGSPSHQTITAERRQLSRATGCGYRGKLKVIWSKYQTAFFQHRHTMLFRIRVTPFYGGGRWWAIPYSMVLCESSGVNFTYGYYSILDPAWQEWTGGLGGHAGDYAKRTQDKAAAVGWDMYGEGAWECKSDGQPHPY